MSKIATALLTLTATLAPSFASAAPLPGFALAAQTERFSFYSRGRDRVDAEKTERYLAQVETLLGQRVSGRAEYYLYATPEEIAAGTGTYARGVTFARARQIHSTEEFHAHEIVHLVAGQLGEPGAFFQEGLAVALGNEGRWNGKRVDAVAKRLAGRLRLAALVRGFDDVDPQIAYPMAGSFVGALIEAHGVAKVAAFFRASTGRDAASAFAEVFGQTLDEAAAEWARAL